MKDSSEYGDRLRKLCNKLGRQYSVPQKKQNLEPVTAIILACLSEYATEAKSATALGKLRSNFVDFNELRVARPEEVVEILGKNFPKVKNVANNIVTLLKDIFDKVDSLDLSDIGENGKREAKAFLESLAGSNSYIISYVMLHCLQGHSFPVNGQMLAMLQGEEVVSSKADMAEVQGFLERQITANDIVDTHFLLRQYADEYKPVKKKTVEAKDDDSEPESVKKTTKKTKKKKAKKKVKKKAKKTTTKITKEKD